MTKGVESIWDAREVMVLDSKGLIRFKLIFFFPVLFLVNSVFPIRPVFLVDVCVLLFICCNILQKPVGRSSILSNTKALRMFTTTGYQNPSCYWKVRSLLQNIMLRIRLKVFYCKSHLADELSLS